MKKLLKIGLVLIIATFIFTACDKNDDELEYNIEYSALPTKAQDFIETHFPVNTVISVKQKHTPETDGSLYELYLNNGVEIEFDVSGTWLKIDGNNSKIIPDSIFLTETPLEAIKTYVTNSYPEYVITEIERKRYGFKVEVTKGASDVDLIFDSAGGFTRIDY